jgi:hypothetical protein
MRQGRALVWISTALGVAGAIGGCAKVNTGTGGGSGGTTGGGGPDAGGLDTARMDLVQRPDLISTVDSADDGACAAVSNSAMLVPLDLYVMMDSSLSMNDATSAGPSKWSAVTSAMSTFFKDPNSAGLGVGLKFFPDEQSGVPASCSADGDCGTYGPCDHRTACVTQNTKNTGTPVICATASDCAGTNKACVPIQSCGNGTYCVSDGTATCPTTCMPFTGYCHARDICDSGDYATPVVSIMTLPGAEPMLTSALDGHSPGGYTPTGPALTGALQYAQQRMTSNPDHKIAIVLVTDGLPGGFIPGMPNPTCAPSDIPGVAGIAASGLPAVPTFVIGIFGPGDLIDPNMNPQANLNMIASAGGTGTAVIVDTSMDVTAQIQAALKLVQTASIACQYAIPKPSSGSLDYNKVNVYFSSASMSSTQLGYVTSKDKCRADLGGWYYDVDPATGGTPTQIIACDQNCSQQFQTDPTAQVNIALGCMSYIIP